MATTKKCNACKIRKEIEKSTEPACCIWYMDNVVLGDKNVNECEIYQEDTEKQKSVDKAKWKRPLERKLEKRLIAMKGVTNGNC